MTSTVVRPASDTGSTGDGADRRLGILLLVLAGALVLNTVLGPLVTGTVDYGLSESLHNQLVGLEVVTVALVAPLCVAAALLVLRGRVAGAVLALGPASYTAYMVVQYVVGPGYERYPGVLAFHLALFVLSGVVAVRAWTAFGPDDLPPMDDRRRRVRTVVLLGLAGFVVLRYLPALAGSLRAEPLTEEFRAEPAFFWSILLMDLGIVVPLVVGAAGGLRRRSPGATKALYAVVGWYALVPPSVAAMAVTMVANDDPHASVGATAVFLVAAVAFTAFAVHVFRPLFAGAPHAAVESGTHGRRADGAG